MFNFSLLHFLLECDETEFNYDTARDVLQRFIDLSSLPAASLSHSDLQTASTLLCVFISLPITAFLLPKAWIALYSLVDLIYKGSCLRTVKDLTKGQGIFSHIFWRIFPIPIDFLE